MSVAQETRNFIKNIEPAKLFTYDDIPNKKKSAVAIELSRLYKEGVIKKVSKGKFYKPALRSFGEIEPSNNDKISSYLKNVSDISYETGLNSFRKLGLTTQVANVITIASSKPYRQVQIDNIKLKFISKKVDAPDEDIYLIQILDALKDIKKIPGTSPNDALLYIKHILKKESESNLKKVAHYALKYPPRARALLGAILKEFKLWRESFMLKETLNPFTTFKIGIDENTLNSKKYWNIQ